MTERLEDILARGKELLAKRAPARCLGAYVGLRYNACSSAAEPGEKRCGACAAAHRQWVKHRRDMKAMEQERAQGTSASKRMRKALEGE